MNGMTETINNDVLVEHSENDASVWLCVSRLQ